MTEGNLTGQVLLDTHTLLWWQGDPEQLSETARRALDAAGSVIVSAVSGWEVALLVDAGRIELDRPVGEWLQAMASQPRVVSMPLDATTAVAAVGLGRKGFHRDPADRFLWATASRHGLDFVTKDQQIHAYARGDDSVRLIW